MAASAAFKAEANDPFGEALESKVSIRIDTSGGSNQLVELTTLENALQISPIIRRREREYGVIQGQTWSVQFTHDGLSFNPRSGSWFSTETSLLFKWAVLELGFPGIDEWDTFAQGRIERWSVSSDGVVTIEIHEPIMDVLKLKLDRDINWQESGWVSDMKQVQTAETSSDFTQDNGAGTDYLRLVGGNEASLINGRYKIVFASATTFDIKHLDEPAYDQTGLSITTNQNVIRGATSVVTIDTNGWDQTPNAYSAGDEFIFYTSKKYAAADLTPVKVVEELLNLAGSVVSYDVISGASQDIRYNTSHWATVNGRFSGIKVGGLWEKDSDAMEMIQEILIGINASLFPSKTGQIGIHHFHPDDIGSPDATLTGDPLSPDVSILSANRIQEQQWAKNRVSIAYKRLGTNADASYEAIDTSSPWDLDLPDPYETRWQFTATTIENTANQLLVRRKADVFRYHVRGTLRELLFHDIAEFIHITEATLSEAELPLQIVEIAVDPIANVCEMIAWTDEFISSEFFRIDVSQVGGTDIIL